MPPPDDDASAARATGARKVAMEVMMRHEISRRAIMGHGERGGYSIEGGTSGSIRSECSVVARQEATSWPGVAFRCLMPTFGGVGKEKLGPWGSGIKKGSCEEIAVRSTRDIPVRLIDKLDTRSILKRYSCFIQHTVWVSSVFTFDLLSRFIVGFLRERYLRGDLTERESTSRIGRSS